MRIIWLQRARVAREAAIEYIAQKNPLAALDQLDEIVRQTDLLLAYPEMGRAGRVIDTRELVINHAPFILVYRLRSDVIQILHFLHGAQQWPNKNRACRSIFKNGNCISK